MAVSRAHTATGRGRTPTPNDDQHVEAGRELLREVASVLRGRDVDRRVLRHRFRTAARTQQDLVATRPGSAEPTSEQRDALERAADGLRGLSATASVLLLHGWAGAPLVEAVEEVAGGLDPEAQPDPARVTDLLPETADDEQRLLLDTMATDIAAVHQAAMSLRFS